MSADRGAGVDGGAGADGGEALAALEAAHERLRAAEERVADHGESAVRAAADAYRRATRLLDSYEGTATGTGTDAFESYLEFQEEFPALVEGLPGDVPEREAFEAAVEAVDRRRLSEDDFAAAREALAPVAEYVDLLEEREAAAEALREARGRARERLATLEDRIDELERLRRLGEADLDAPVGELREPVSAYNEAVREDFAAFKSGESARAFLRFVDRADEFPLIDYRAPPAELLEYAEKRPAGEESVSDLLSYEEFSASKLEHYVKDPGAFRTRVSVHRTYLERLDAAPLTVAWPPPPAGELRFRGEELRRAVEPFARERTVAALRRVRGLARREDYGRLREAAVAEAELDEAERERLAAGAVEDDLDAARERRRELAAALEEYEDP